MLSFAAPADFRLTADGEAREYLFNRHVISHRFCPTWGIEPFAYGTAPDGRQMIAVNVNCLDGVDARALNGKAVDAASF